MFERSTKENARQITFSIEKVVVHFLPNPRHVTWQLSGFLIKRSQPEQKRHKTGLKGLCWDMTLTNEFIHPPWSTFVRSIRGSRERAFLPRLGVAAVAASAVVVVVEFLLRRIVQRRAVVQRERVVVIVVMFQRVQWT